MFIIMGDCMIVKTNKNGEANLRVKKGTYNLSVSKEGYKEVNSKITVDNDDVEIKIILEKIDDGSD